MKMFNRLITNFQDKIPTDLRELVLGEEEIMDNETKEKSAIFKNKLWLWGIMILLLDFVAVRMIREW